MKETLLKVVRLGRTWAFMCFARVKNLVSRRSVIGDGECVISLTSFGDRLNSVFYTLESIGRGKALPSRIILWIDNVEQFSSLPGSLVRLRNRGVEIRLTGNYGPHTKYYPFVASQEIGTRPLVTADDDVIYTHDWLDQLLRTHRAHPNDVVAHRVHYVELSSTGAILPYQNWSAGDGTVSLRNFATGVSGVLYPSSFQMFLKSQRVAFLAFAPKADDVWLHVMSLRSDTSVRQVSMKPKHYSTVWGTQASNLWSSNVFSGGNDSQIKASYSDSDMAKLKKQTP